jgi:single-strand DNA-binding protein
MSNSINVVGNLTGDPELRYTQSGTAMVSGSIASNRRYQVNGEWQEQTSYFNFTAWRELAENLASTMTKGMRVVATGRMEQKDWVDKEGNKRTSYDLVLDEIGPSLRWATAVVTKTDKNGSGSSSPSIVTASAAFNATVVEEDPF